MARTSRPRRAEAPEAAFDLAGGGRRGAGTAPEGSCPAGSERLHNYRAGSARVVLARARTRRRRRAQELVTDARWGWCSRPRTIAPSSACRMRAASASPSGRRDSTMCGAIRSVSAGRCVSTPRSALAWQCGARSSAAGMQYALRRSSIGPRPAPARELEAAGDSHERARAHADVNYRFSHDVAPLR